MLSRQTWKYARSRLLPVIRQFSEEKPPKGFEKYYKKKAQKKQNESEEGPKQAPNDGPKEDPKTERPLFDGYLTRFKKSWEKYNNINIDPRDYKNRLLIAALLGLGFGLNKYLNYEHVPFISFQEFTKKYLSTGKVKKIDVIVRNNTKNTDNSLHIAKVYDTEDKEICQIKIPDLLSFKVAMEEVEVNELLKDKKNHIPVKYREASPASPVLLMMVDILFLAFMILSFTMSNSVRKGSSKGKGTDGFMDMFNPSKNHFKVYGVDGKKIDVGFKDVAGQLEAKKEIMEFVEFLKSPQKFKKLGARIPRGALLCGPPGTGKTLLAKAAAGEAGVPFFSMSGSEFTEMFVGVGASRVRQLFKQAREKAPSIIFIDEIDAVGRKRGSKFGGNDEKDNTLNQLLVEMDGFSTDTHVVIFGGTNRKDVLDSALLRPGRFDRTVELTLPDIQEREEILKVHLAPILLNPEMSTEQYAKRIAALSPGFSGAELANLCNEAAILAARTEKEFVDKNDFETASERIMGGLEMSKKLPPHERSIVAHHEAGHAVSGWFLEGADPVLKVSILPRSKGALGFAQFLPSDNSLYNRKELLDKICSILGGRVAEEIFFGKITTGAQNDLQQATNIAQNIVATCGYSEKLGTIGYNMDKEEFMKPYSEDTNRIIDVEVRNIVEDCLAKTRVLLEQKKDLMENLAKDLLEKERVTHKDLIKILGPRPFEMSTENRRYLEEESSIPAPIEEKTQQTESA